MMRPKTQNTINQQESSLKLFLADAKARRGKNVLDLKWDPWECGSKGIPWNQVRNSDLRSHPDPRNQNLHFHRISR